MDDEFRMIIIAVCVIKSKLRTYALIQAAILAMSFIKKIVPLTMAIIALLALMTLCCFFSRTRCEHSTCFVLFSLVDYNWHIDFMIKLRV